MIRTSIKPSAQQYYSHSQRVVSETSLSCSLPRKTTNIVDILRTAPSAYSFEVRVKNICLTPCLERKIIERINHVLSPATPTQRLNQNEEKELATEVLLARHSFTRLVHENSFFRQAAITIIQNIYLFQQRRIFFAGENGSPDQERQAALMLFGSPEETSLPLAKTFQHLIVARVWDRIINQASNAFLDSSVFLELHDVVERLNTLRNIYMIMSAGLIHSFTQNISSIYRQSINKEDAIQIGNFGVARAAYRYHPSSGQRFSTFASRWVRKEIQRQSLEGRLIRISANLVDQLSQAMQNGKHSERQTVLDKLQLATTVPCLDETNRKNDYLTSSDKQPQAVYEQKENKTSLYNALLLLTEKNRDILQRRYGLGKYHGKEQSIIEISKIFGVSRSSIYQREQGALEKLRMILENMSH